MRFERIRNVGGDISDGEEESEGAERTGGKPSSCKSTSNVQLPHSARERRMIKDARSRGNGTRVRGRGPNAVSVPSTSTLCFCKVRSFIPDNLY